MSKKEQHVQSQRPLSPHLSIYKPQITSILSIAHRFSGVVLFAGSWLLALWVIFSTYGCASCFNTLIASIYGQIALFLWSAALYYHLLNGIRHLFWDIGMGFEIKTVSRSGVAVLVGTLALLAGTWSTVWGVW